MAFSTLQLTSKNEQRETDPQNCGPTASCKSLLPFPQFLGAKVTGRLVDENRTVTSFSFCHTQLLTSGFTPVLNLPSTPDSYPDSHPQLSPPCLCSQAHPARASLLPGLLGGEHWRRWRLHLERAACNIPCRKPGSLGNLHGLHRVQRLNWMQLDPDPRPGSF